MADMGNQEPVSIREAGLRRLFPGLATSYFRITSDATSNYNCIAWAAEDVSQWWGTELFAPGKYRWPEAVERRDSIAGWAAAFEALGYASCESTSPEPGFDKLALYALPSGDPTHVARQLPSGRWTSKLGKLEDIEHDLDGLEGTSYGRVVRVLKRQRLAGPPSSVFGRWSVGKRLFALIAIVGERLSPR